jgi:uncharacterized protein YoxC
MNRRMNLKRVTAICIAFSFLMTAITVLPTNAKAAQFEIVTQIGSIPAVRVDPAAMVTDDGMLLVVGGTDDAAGSTLYNTVIQYGLENHSVSYGATIPNARFYPDYAVGNDGNLYVFGGWNGGYQSDVQIYNPVNDTWWTNTGAPTTLGAGCAVTCTNGSILVFNHPWSPGTYMYIPSTDTWHTMTASSTVTWAGTSAVRLNNGSILVMGGLNAAVNAIATCEIYNPLIDSWSSAANMPIAAGCGAAFMGNDGFVYYIGGSSAWPNTGTETNAIQRYDPTTDTWIIVSATISPDKAMFGFALDQEGNAYVVGGFNTAGLSDIDMIQTMNLADEDEIIALKGQITDLKDQILQLQSDVANLQTKDTELLEKIADLNDDLNQTEDALNNAINDANNAADDANTAASNANMMALIGVLVGIIGIVVGLVAMMMAKKKGGQGPQMVPQPGQMQQ